MRRWRQRRDNYPLTSYKSSLLSSHERWINFVFVDVSETPQPLSTERDLKGTVRLNSNTIIFLVSTDMISFEFFASLFAS